MALIQFKKNIKIIAGKKRNIATLHKNFLKINIAKYTFICLGRMAFIDTAKTGFCPYHPGNRSKKFFVFSITWVI